MEASSRGVLSELVRFLEDRFPHLAPITAQSRISGDLGLDSLAAMDLLMNLEDRFDVSIPLNALPDLDSVGDLAVVIEKGRKGAVRR